MDFEDLLHQRRTNVKHSLQTEWLVAAKLLFGIKLNFVTQSIRLDFDRCRQSFAPNTHVIVAF